MQTGWIPLIPDSASTISGKVDALYFYLSGVTVFFTLLISLVIIFFVIKYRRRSAFEIPRPIAGSHKLETLWSVIPFLIAMSMFAWGAQVYFENSRSPKNANEIYVVGKQWMWKIQHSTGQREINELHVPVGRKIKLIMTSEDTIHDFFVPAFRIKADVLPGRYTTQWFEATKAGTYHLFCAEYCGMNHSGMIGSVIVMQPTEFDNWLSGNSNQQSPAVAGQQLYQSLGCVSCHGQNGEGGRGPALANLSGSKVFLTNGQTVTADEAYLRESIENPSAKVVNGFSPIMPTFQGQVTPEQLIQIISYIKSLQVTGAPVTSPPASAAAPSATPVPKPTNHETIRIIRDTNGRARELYKRGLRSKVVVADQRPQAHRAALSWFHFGFLFHRRVVRHVHSP
jgi:cytochrome c oxidase subunit II